MTPDAPALGTAIDYPALLAGHLEPIDFYDSRRHLDTLAGPVFAAGVALRAGVLNARGLRRGDRIALVANNTEDYLTTLLAVLLLGAVPCAIAPPPAPAREDSAGVQHLRAALRVLDPAMVVATQSTAAAICHHRLLLDDELAGHRATDLPDAVAPQPDDVHHIQLTSGSTSAPKAVVLTHGNVAHNIAAIGAATGATRGRDRIFSWLPMYHDMGFILVLGGLLFGLPIGLMSPLGFLRDPLSWLRHMTDHESTITAGPTFGYAAATAALARARAATAIDLRRLRQAFVGAEPIPRATLWEFTESFAPLGLRADALVPCYGMAESVLATTLADRPAPPGPGAFGRVRALNLDGTGWSPVSCGRPIDGMDVRVVDPDGTDAGDGVVGDIRISGPSLMAGYLGPDGVVQRPADGWHDTGDRGLFCAGELFVVGRDAEMLIVRGRNLPPHDVERAIGALPQVGPGQVVVFSVPDDGRGRESVVAVVATALAGAGRREQLQLDANRLVREGFGFSLDQVVLVPKGSVLRTTSGKIQRLTTRDRYLAGQLPAR